MADVQVRFAHRTTTADGIERNIGDVASFDTYYARRLVRAGYAVYVSAADPEDTSMPIVELPVRVPLDAYRGDTFRETFRWRLYDAAGNLTGYADLTDCTAKAQVRVAENDPTLVVELTCDVPDYAVKPGACVVSLTPVQTTALPAGFEGVYDLQLTHPNGDVITYFAGPFTTDGQVTVP